MVENGLPYEPRPVRDAIWVEVTGKGGSVTLTAAATLRNTDFDWPVIFADEGTLTPINDSQAVFIPALRSFVNPVLFA